MLIYSKKIVQFIGEITATIKNVLAHEVRLRVAGNYFYDRRQQSSYPIKVVISNQNNVLGYFDPNFYELGFHECLMFANKYQLGNVIRHELAHYITFINYGALKTPHAPEFREFCERVGWGEEVYKASFDLKVEADAMQENGVLRKVQKLLALATSSNQYEAEQAMIKSQELLLQYNIDAQYAQQDNDEKVFLKRIMKQKRKNAKMQAIARILGTFFVSVVYARQGEFVYLDIVGSSVNIEIAEYVAQVLDNELDRLWQQAQTEKRLKGMVARNSFFRGIAIGYCNKIQALKGAYNDDARRALMIIDKQLITAKEMIYERLKHTYSKGRCCSLSAALGEQMGRELHINPAITKQANTAACLQLT